MALTISTDNSRVSKQRYLKLQKCMLLQSESKQFRMKIKPSMAYLAQPCSTKRARAAMRPQKMSSQKSNEEQQPLLDLIAFRNQLAKNCRTLIYTQHGAI